MGTLKYKTPETVDIMHALKSTRSFLMNCEVCEKVINTGNTQLCEHHKNGYCALFRLQAARDMLEIKNKSK